MVVEEVPKLAEAGSLLQVLLEAPIELELERVGFSGHSPEGWLMLKQVLRVWEREHQGHQVREEFES